MKRLCLLIAGCVLTLAIFSCPGVPGLLPFYISGDPTAKTQIHPLAFDTHLTRVAVYIDAENYTPLNALYYVLADGTQFFDYVILGSLELRRGRGGVYIHIPPGLSGLLERHSTHIRPLQEAGIKVLLGIRGGHAGVTFPTIPNLDLPDVLQSLEAIMHASWLDGFEIWDIDGADIAMDWEDDRTGFPYPSGTHRLADGTYHTIEPDEFSDMHWRGMSSNAGGDAMSDFILLLRTQLLGGAAADGIVGGDIERFIIIAREENHGAWIAPDPPSGTFTMIFEHLNFTVNPNPASFGSGDGWGIANFPYGNSRRPGGSAIFHIEDNRQFGPLAIELNPANSRLDSTTVVPPIVDLENGDCIFNFTIRFYDGHFFDDGSDEFAIPRYSQFGIIHYRGLRPTRAVITDGVLGLTTDEYDTLIAAMIEKRDYLGFDFPIDDDTIQTIRIGGQLWLTQAGYMSITSLFVFGQPVIMNRIGGGNHIKDW